jgi:nicotinamide riboside kinase
VIEVWSAYKYESVSSYISSLLQEDLFDLHILCKPDIPWDPDPLRENPEDRDFLFERYIAALEKHHKNYIIVEGSSDKRIEKSIKSIHRIQNK